MKTKTEFSLENMVQMISKRLEKRSLKNDKWIYHQLLPYFRNIVSCVDSINRDWLLQIMWPNPTQNKNYKTESLFCFFRDKILGVSTIHGCGSIRIPYERFLQLPMCANCQDIDKVCTVLKNEILPQLNKELRDYFSNIDYSYYPDVSNDSIALLLYYKEKPTKN